MDSIHKTQKTMDKKTDRGIKGFIAEVAKKYPNLVASYLFGSYAKGNFHKDSDIDLALVMDDLADDEKFDIQVQLMLLASQFDSRIEPHPISKEDFGSVHPLAAEVRKTGIEIHSKTSRLV